MSDKETLNKVIKQVYNQEKPVKDNWFKEIKEKNILHDDRITKDKKKLTESIESLPAVLERIEDNLWEYADLLDSLYEKTYNNKFSFKGPGTKTNLFGKN